jgi:hypothetical protein
MEGIMKRWIVEILHSQKNPLYVLAKKQENGLYFPKKAIGKDEYTDPLYHPLQMKGQIFFLKFLPVIFTPAGFKPLSNLDFLFTKMHPPLTRDSLFASIEDAVIFIEAFQLLEKRMKRHEYRTANY